MRRPVLGAMLVSSLVAGTGCTSWKVRTTPAAQILTEKPLQTIRIVTVDSIPVTLHQARVVGDSVTGHPTARAVERRTIHLRDIATVATKVTNLGKTLVVGAAIAAGLLAYSWLQGLNSTSP
ncbi:MAG: hypothetical protein FJ206_09250 [Gemmatimonadetes bacterium]|nr:hypothetical protein [Gemmatimonadota bacterium]